MYSAILNQITDKLVSDGIIKEEEKELYAYGLQQGILILSNLAITIILSLLVGMLYQSILFLIAYLPLRVYGGGYHAKTQRKCFYYSVLLSSVVLLVIKIIPVYTVLLVFLVISAGIIVYELSPVEDVNKPLDQVEIMIYRRKTRSILLLEMMILLLLFLIDCKKLALPITVSIIVMAIMVLLGKIRQTQK
ncbi:MAG: accessory protein regulator protein [Herbinix sp.]|jgi:accessory gene regulator B|nr:accessory protein regulator protein [Herbinix sp.]